MIITVNNEISLSPIQESDRVACVEHLKEKQIYDQTGRIPFPYRDADFEQWFKMVEDATREQGREVHWAIRNQSNDLIGVIGFLEGAQLGKTHRGEIGYWLAKPYWGRGIMSAVVRAVCDIAFRDFALHKLTAEAFANNPASARVLEKCGFVQEGFLRQHFIKDGQLRDVKIFGLLKL